MLSTVTIHHLRMVFFMMRGVGWVGEGGGVSRLTEIECEYVGGMHP